MTTWTNRKAAQYFNVDEERLTNWLHRDATILGGAATCVGRGASATWQWDSTRASAWACRHPVHWRALAAGATPWTRPHGDPPYAWVCVACGARHRTVRQTIAHQARCRAYLAGGTIGEIVQDRRAARLTGAEAANVLGVSVGTVRRAIAAGTYPPEVYVQRPGRRAYFDGLALRRWAAAGETLRSSDDRVLGSQSVVPRTPPRQVRGDPAQLLFLPAGQFLTVLRHLGVAERVAATAIRRIRVAQEESDQDRRAAILRGENITATKRREE